MRQLAKAIRKRQEDNYDVNIIVDGPRGNGKSTFMYKLFCELGGFVPENDIVFSRDDVIEKMKDTYGLIMADEMINAGHNRDFYQKEQKILIKMLNMYRDNYNIMAGAIPFFYDLDPQVRKFYAIRVTIHERGKAILQKPGKSMYSNDPWETDVNRKLEGKMQGVIKKGKKLRLNYTKLTTFWGTLEFGALSKRQEERYHKIKADKRAQLMEPEEEEKVEKEMSEMMLLAQKFDNQQITKADIESYCRIHGKKYTSLMATLRNNLKSRRVLLVPKQEAPLVSQAG